MDLDYIWDEAYPELSLSGLTLPHPRAGARPFVLKPLGWLRPALAGQLRDRLPLA